MTFSLQKRKHHKLQGKLFIFYFFLLVTIRHSFLAKSVQQNLKFQRFISKNLTLTHHIRLAANYLFTSIILLWFLFFFSLLFGLFIWFVVSYLLSCKDKKQNQNKIFLNISLYGNFMKLKLQDILTSIGEIISTFILFMLYQYEYNIYNNFLWYFINHTFNIIKRNKIT